MLKGVNWIAVLVAVVLLEAIGYLWYGMVFSSAWTAEMSAIGLKPDTSASAQTTSIALGALLIVVEVLGLAWLMRRLETTNWRVGALDGFTAWFFFGLTTQGMEYVYMGFTPTLMAINCGQLLVSYVVAGAVLGGLKFRAPKATVTA